MIDDGGPPSAAVAGAAPTTIVVPSGEVAIAPNVGKSGCSGRGRSRPLATSQERRAKPVPWSVSPSGEKASITTGAGRAGMEL